MAGGITEKQLDELLLITGSSTLIGLTDTPLSYAGSAGKILVVNGLEDAMEFSDYPAETVTTLNLNTNMLTYVDELGVSTNIDLSIYLDDTNLSRIVSGTVDANGLATMTRDDATFFTWDLAVLIDANNYSFHTIISGKTVTIPSNQVMYLHEPLLLEGTLVIEPNGKLTLVEDSVATPVEDATEAVKGIVLLASDGQNAPNVVVQGDDSRLSDARTPLSHTHISTDITDFVTAVQAAQVSETTTTMSAAVDREHTYTNEAATQTVIRITNFSVHTIPLGETLTVPTNEIMYLLNRPLILDGTLIIEPDGHVELLAV